ncbi:bifunctional adenosylcobinamide kinase/adenosylcobinamide-phosphate guanylyltransferase [Puniceibacterium sp. IMCC21224]|uniref:bifunctional adenosylcobinamide kinase/adenosylcobinamide-phosphate guanylyltransferase n=1 Tax=Puniceibacterium sp. IMCC21224 TaxID=1618204 RepID=UPI00064DE769|nr:bifunctional adenosylcobinamide kinase/adenosylcobinamide-phosphate guanylyltransferase [Puniceibacterium sp. IMCC21224]KMK65735.1 adenosylcobinamide-phosphate guanylyltransferase [Puniceibacterium sp. IMCC21224]
MPHIMLVTGGAKSGKSAFAEAQARTHSGQPVYIATAERGDAEMRARIDRHQLQRGPDWRTIEEPLNLLGALERAQGNGAVLVDCLTLWLSNLMLAGADWQGAVAQLCAALPMQPDPVILVTNEVGQGIVPANALAREYCDASGVMNQALGAVADSVVLVVCGQSLRIK